MKNILVTVVAAGLVWTTGCGDDSAVKETRDSGSPTPTDSGTPNPGDTDGGKDCFDNPKTHFEIINACTNATRITKNPTLDKLLPDGGLPPLN